MLTLSASLLAHQKARRRQPALSVVAEVARFGVPYYALESVDTAADTDCPSAAVYDHTNSGIVRVRNNAGALDWTTDYGGSWTNLDTVTAGQGFALAYDETNATVILAYGDGNDLKVRTISDITTWSSATVILTEASAIGSVALAADASGDACAFYTLGTTTTLKRVRRTSGSWAASGTSWSRSADVATLTGLSAVWSTDYYLAVTGTEATTNHERLWCYAMGDLGLPANAWSTGRTVAEADADASTTFAYPHLVVAYGGFLFLSFQQTEAGDVAASRAMLTSVNAAIEPLAPWREPYPLPATTTAYGAPLAWYAFFDVLYALTADVQLAKSRGTTVTRDLSSYVTSLSWRETPYSLRVQLQLEYASGDAVLNPTAFGSVPVRLGYDLKIKHGMLSSSATPPAAEYGTQILANISRIARTFEPGKTRITIEAGGPWEQMARFRAPNAWTAPSGETRGEIFQRIAGRAGLTVAEASGDFTPSTAWTTDTPTFSIAPGEQASTTLRRLLAATTDALRENGSTGGFEVCGVSQFNSATRTVGWNATGSTHPLLSVSLSRQHYPNWVRAFGPDRYADAFFTTAWWYGGPYPTEPIYEVVRDQNATTDALAEAAAAGALDRARFLEPVGELIAPLAAELELYDTVSVDLLEPAGSLTDGFSQLENDYLIVGRGVDYRAGPRPVFNSVLAVGEGSTVK